MTLCRIPPARSCRGQSPFRAAAQPGSASWPSCGKPKRPGVGGQARINAGGNVGSWFRLRPVCEFNARTAVAGAVTSTSDGVPKPVYDLWWSTAANIAAAFPTAPRLPNRARSLASKLTTTSIVGGSCEGARRSSCPGSQANEAGSRKGSSSNETLPPQSPLAASQVPQPLPNPRHHHRD